MLTTVEFEDKALAARALFETGRRLSLRLWEEAREQGSKARHENRHEAAREWARIEDHALEAWIGAGLEAYCRVKLVCEGVDSILRD